MLPFDLVLVNKRGDLTHNCSCWKSMQVPKAFVYFCIQKNEAAQHVCLKVERGSHNSLATLEAKESSPPGLNDQHNRRAYPVSQKPIPSGRPSVWRSCQDPDGQCWAHGDGARLCGPSASSALPRVLWLTQGRALPPSPRTQLMLSRDHTV